MIDTTYGSNITVSYQNISNGSSKISGTSEEDKSGQEIVNEQSASASSAGGMGGAGAVGAGGESSSSSDSSDIEDQIEALEKQLQQLKQQLAQMANDENPYTSQMREGLQVQINAISSQIQALSSLLNDQQG